MKSAHIPFLIPLYRLAQLRERLQMMVTRHIDYVNPNPVSP